MQTYDRIGTGYNDTRRADPYLLDRMEALLAITTGQKMLDIGCGTGNYTRALATRGIDISGVDPSEKMLQKARSIAPEMKWGKGSAEALPFSDECFEAILASLTLHHWKDLKAGFREMARVLNLGGKLVIFTSTPAQMEGYWLWHYFPRMMEDSCAQMPTRERVEEATREAGLREFKWETYAVRPDLQDQFLYVGKEKPSLYLDPRIRAGISSFAALAYESEVKSGLLKLETDIASGAIEAIMDRYKHKMGDYAFFIARKAG
ncbi:MAG: methyltransferase domain-containing protein [Bacteroidota bacterium]